MLLIMCFDTDYLKKVINHISDPTMWKTSLKANFQEKVIYKCSLDTPENLANKKEEKNIGKFTEIRNEILRRLVDTLYEARGLVATPSYHTLEWIVLDILAS